MKQTRQSTRSHARSVPSRKRAPSPYRLKKVLRLIAPKLKVPAATLYRDMRLNPRQSCATVGKLLALSRCLCLCGTRTTWESYGKHLCAGGHLPRSFRTVRGAWGFSWALARALEPIYVARRDAVFARMLLRTAAEEYGGEEWARPWLRRKREELGTRTPRAAAGDFAGLSQALQLLVDDLKRRASLGACSRKQ